MKFLQIILKLSVAVSIATIAFLGNSNFLKIVSATEQSLSLDISKNNSTNIKFSKSFKTESRIKKKYSSSTISLAKSPILFAQISIGKTVIYILLFVIAGAIIVFLVSYLVPIIVQIGQNEAGIVYKKFGKALPPNRQIALNGELGWQIDILSPGRHYFRPFWMYRVIKKKSIKIGTNEIGLVVAKDGASLPTGRMFGHFTKNCDDFQNGRVFINGGGQRGNQVAILKNGIYRINTELFDVDPRPITNINDDEIGLVEAKDGRPLSSGKTFGNAVECSNFEDAQAFIDNGGYRGKQLKILTAGKYAINVEMFKITKVNPIKIGSNEVGLVEAKDGQQVSLGQNFGKVVECNNFQDAVAFIKNGGQKGKQLAILSNGIYYINIALFQVSIAPVINVPAGEIAVVIAQDGKPLPPGQILGKSVECNNFQDAAAFIRNGGQKGKQRTILTAGEYRINTELFTVITTANAKQHSMKSEELKIYRVEANKIGIVTTLDGKPLPAGDIAGVVIEGNNKFQEVQKFIDAGGYRGLQEEILEEGSWSLNPWFVKVEQVLLTNIEAGTVGVIISNIGDNIEQKDENIGQNTEKTADESKFNIVPKGYKGIEEIPLQAGNYPINTRVKSIEIVPSHEITLDWTNRDKPKTNYDFNLKTLQLRSQDAFIFDLEVTQVINIAPSNAPKMISRVGSPIANNPSETANEGQKFFNQNSQNKSSNAVKHSSINNLVTRVLEPMVGNYFRNSAADYDALEFLKKRDELQEGATEHIKAALNAYGVEAVGTFINEIDLPDALEERIKAQKIAEVESAKLKKEQETEKELQNLIKEQELTKSQGELIKAEQNRIIAEEKAKARERDAKADSVAQKLKDDLEINKKREEINIEVEQQKRLAELEMKKFRDKVQTLTPELYAKSEADKVWSKAFSEFENNVPEIYIGGGNGNSGGMEALQSGQFQVMMMEMFGEYLKDRQAKRINTSDVNPERVFDDPSNQK